MIYRKDAIIASVGTFACGLALGSGFVSWGFAIGFTLSVGAFALWVRWKG